jgi:hypothetical protein
LTLQYDKVIFILKPDDITSALKGKRVTACDYPDGRLDIECGDVRLPYRQFDKLQRVTRAAIVENKRLGAALA